MADTKAPQQIDSLNSVDVPLFSNSIHTYLNYSRKMQGRLAELNNNVSNVIKESCSGIDNICNRVRQCLYEMDNSHKTYLLDEVTEYDIEEVKSKSCEDVSQEIVETIEDVSTIEIVEEEKSKVESNPEKVTSLTPFFTEINCNDQDNRESCQKRILNKTIYSLLSRNMELQNNDSRFGLDHFKGAVSTLCDNFEVMNKLVENINDEINKFSETTIPTTKSIMKIKSKELNKSMLGLKPIKRLSKSNSRQKSVQVGDCLSESEVDYMDLHRDSSSFIIPDVYRKRAFTDLYDKLVAQIEANDSLIFFQTLMNRQKKLHKNKDNFSQFKLNVPIMNYSFPLKSPSNSSNKSEVPRKIDLRKKYADSLWFSQRNMVRDRSRKEPKKNVRSRKVNVKTIENRSEHYEGMENAKKKTTISESRFNSMGDVARRACSLECTCRMVVQNDMAPPASTKCQLQWLRAKPVQAAQRKLKFLDILDDLTYRDLLPIQSEYPRKDNQPTRQLVYKDIQDTYLYKLMYGKYGSKNVWKQLLESQCCKKSNYNKPVCSPSVKRIKDDKANESFMGKFCMQNYSKSDILRKLSRYMFDPDNMHENYSQSVIVMPVRVYYDNIRPNEPPTKLSSPSQSFNVSRRVSASPSRDTKWHKMLELSTPKIARPMRVVYDSLPKKLEIPPIAMSIKPSAMPSKPQLSSGRLNKDNNLTKKVSSKSFPPKSFSMYCPNIKSARRDPMKQHESGPLYSKIQADIEKIKKDIYGPKVNPPDRKLWANKYGKSVGQKLISFVDNQKVEPVRPVPLYAVPKLDLSEPPRVKKNVNFAEKINHHKQVLNHVKNLKTKNRAIQNNLKKAIDVIESRMVDILGDDSRSSQAFDVMEKEITNVLSLMKCKGRMDLNTISSKSCDVKDEAVTVSDKDLKPSLEDNYNIISEHLFERLERILDTGGSSMSNTSIHKTDEITPHVRKMKEEVKKKQKSISSRRTKLGLNSPSSSASLDEKIINKRSSKGYSKKMARSEVKPKLSATMTALISEPITQQWENVCGDQNSIKSALNDESQTDSKVTEEDKSQDQIWNNSSGDFVKQEEVLLKSDSNAEIDHTIVNRVISEDEVEKLPSEPKSEMLPKIFSPQLKVDGSNVTINSDVEEFINEELNKVIESIVSLTEEVSVNQPPNEPIIVNHEKENIESSDYNTPRSALSENKIKGAIRDGATDYSEEVQKIINRMENIYCQLDDIQESESKDKIPVFKEVDVSEVQSEIFLTPFMQAVKENRKNQRPASKMSLVEKSPSYYNVITFLDALTNIQKEAPYEVHTAQLCNYSYVCYQTSVIYQADICCEAQLSSSTSVNIPLSCIKESSAETKQAMKEKVSFFQMSKEDKSNQVALCPFHRVKVVRISSQQFPPLDRSHDDIRKKISDSNRTDCVPVTINNNFKEKETQKLCPLHSADQKKHQHSTSHKPKTTPCKLHKEVGDSCDLPYSGLGRSAENKESPEETNKCELSVLDDKSTQVFCQMQADQKQEDSTTVYITANEDTCISSNEDQSGDRAEYLDGNPDDSKSTDKDFLEDSLLDPFYDYTNDNITPKGVMQTIESIYEEGNAKHTKDSAPAQPKIVVFREVIESSLQPPKDLKNVNDIEQYKKRLEKRKEMRLLRRPSSESVTRTVSMTHGDNENVILLKSFYAIVYILVFTALSMDYRCI